jgi:hypothetical protein
MHFQKIISMFLTVLELVWPSLDTVSVESAS